MGETNRTIGGRTAAISCLSREIGSLIIILMVLILPISVCAQTRDSLEKPRGMLDRCRETLHDPGLTIIKDRSDSDTDPGVKLRRIELKFYDQEINGRKWGHPCVVFMPADHNYFRLTIPYLRASNEAYRHAKYEYHMYNINKIQ